MRDTHSTSECSQKCGPRKISARRQKTSFGRSFFAIVLEIESTLFADREMTGRWWKHTPIFQNVRKIRQKLVPHFSYTFGHDFSLTVYSPLCLGAMDQRIFHTNKMRVGAKDLREGGWRKL